MYKNRHMQKLQSTSSQSSLSAVSSMFSERLRVPLGKPQPPLALLQDDKRKEPARAIALLPNYKGLEIIFVLAEDHNSGFMYIVAMEGAA
jgi:hypothetical protein